MLNTTNTWASPLHRVCHKQLYCTATFAADTSAGAAATDVVGTAAGAARGTAGADGELLALGLSSTADAGELAAAAAVGAGTALPLAARSGGCAGRGGYSGGG